MQLQKHGSCIQSGVLRSRSMHAVSLRQPAFSARCVAIPIKGSDRASDSLLMDRQHKKPKPGAFSERLTIGVVAIHSRWGAPLIPLPLRVRDVPGNELITLSRGPLGPHVVMLLHAWQQAQRPGGYIWTWLHVQVVAPNQPLSASVDLAKSHAAHLLLLFLYLFFSFSSHLI